MTAPQKRNGEPGDWMYIARALSGGRVKLFKRKMHISLIESYASPTKVFMSRIQWKVSIWVKVEMSIGKLRFGKTTPNIFFDFSFGDCLDLCW